MHFVAQPVLPQLSDAVGFKYLFVADNWNVFGLSLSDQDEAACTCYDF
jgi:hypothetical protein